MKVHNIIIKIDGNILMLKALSTRKVAFNLLIISPSNQCYWNTISD